MTENGDKSKPNRYATELNKMLGHRVVVKTTDNEVLEGECRGIGMPHMNVALMTDTEKILVKNVKTITRLRKSQTPSGKEEAA